MKHQNTDNVPNPYSSIKGTDTKCKPLILKWLANIFGYENYPHSFKNQWITWSIWGGELSVSFDSRVEEQQKLLSLIQPRFLGTPQRNTLKIVNEKNFYINLDRFLDINYPDIIGSKLLSKNKQRGGTGGWHSADDDYYTYDWEVFLSDGSSILFNNQEEVMNLVKGSYTYHRIIEERAFVNFLYGLK